MRGKAFPRPIPRRKSPQEKKGKGKSGGRKKKSLTEQIDRLKSAYRLKFKMADLFRFTAEELRAQINQNVIGHMSRDEVEDAGRFNKKRTEQERKIAGG